ncbi:MAG: preprotein translocase subunit SecG [Crocinitomicaceae bacterium]|nr:preprotein translocase subunit SecG [Crocinitomicaceae bacterium]MBK8924305.1 preprotein translocase subunit SecG [Crocinitomicaceae bacterium]
MTTLFTVLIILGSLGLILFVLVQNPKGGGLNADFGSAVQLGGAKRATDILEKGTWGLAVGIALICLIMAKDAVQTSGATEGTPSDIEADPNAVDDNVGQPAPAQPFNVPGNP